MPAHTDKDRQDDAAFAEAAVLTGEAGVDAHGHVHSSRAPWLIMAPILVLLLAPPALGADAVSRASGSQAIAGVQPVSAQVVTGDGGYAPNDGSGSAPTGGASGGLLFPALPDAQDPPLALKATVLRALYDSAGSVTKRAVTVIGFITPPGAGFSDGYSIARISISCCAADANALQLHVAGTAPYPANTWVQAVLTAIPGSGTQANNYVPSVTVTSVKRCRRRATRTSTESPAVAPRAALWPRPLGRPSTLVEPPAGGIRRICPLTVQPNGKDSGVGRGRRCRPGCRLAYSPRSPSNSPASIRFFTAPRNRAASAPSTLRWS